MTSKDPFRVNARVLKIDIKIILAVFVIAFDTPEIYRFLEMVNALLKLFSNFKSYCASLKVLKLSGNFSNSHCTQIFRPREELNPITLPFHV